MTIKEKPLHKIITSGAPPFLDPGQRLELLHSNDGCKCCGRPAYRVYAIYASDVPAPGAPGRVDTPPAPC